MAEYDSSSRKPGRLSISPSNLLMLAGTIKPGITAAICPWAAADKSLLPALSVTTPRSAGYSLIY